MYQGPYLDYNATTPCSKNVIDSMLPYFDGHFGNASSSHHSYGWMAKSAVEEATGSIAKILGVPTSDLIYSSGATESINAIVKGIAQKMKSKGKHIITSRVEHKAVLDTCDRLAKDGYEISYLEVDSKGLIAPEQLRKVLRPDTILVSIQYANNETGVLQPLDAIAQIVHDKGSLLFSDTTQALGKVDVRPILQLVDFACFSGHKIYGPKGIGLTYIKDNDFAALPGFIHGGGQQKGQRGGTINTPLIMGLATAVQETDNLLEKEMARIQVLRDHLESGLLKIEMAVNNSISDMRLPNTVNISFPYVDGGSLLSALGTKIAVSNGSACTSATVIPSHVLTAMGVDPSLAMASLRLSLGRYTTSEDIQKAITIITDEVAQQRRHNILWERRGD